MHVVREKTSAFIQKSRSDNDFQNEFCGLSFYTTSPAFDVTISDFEGFAIDRLKVLHAIDRHIKTDFVLTERDAELEKVLVPELKKAGLFLDVPRDNEDRKNFLETKERFVRKDVMSHFILRLAFCKSKESGEWFIKTERKLLQFRATLLTLFQRQSFYASTGFFNFRHFDGSASDLAELQKMTVGARIYAAEGKKSWSEETFFEIPFIDIPAHFVARRKVVLKRGMAYVPNAKFTELVQDKFKRHLEEQLVVANRGLPHAMKDTRVSAFLKKLQDCGQTLFVAKPIRYDSGEKLTLELFENIYKRSFPPCMRRLVEAPRERGVRLKHQGKLQLRPFLKDCGLDLEDSVTWWRQEALRDKEITAEKFDKNFLYDIEHTYGKKGHMKEQNCFGCSTIINFPYPPTGQVHGCPFKHMEAEPLIQTMRSWGVPEKNIADMNEHIVNKHFQLACQDYFRGIHPGSTGDGVGNHPHGFYQESSAYYKKRSEKEKLSGDTQQEAE